MTTLLLKFLEQAVGGSEYITVVPQSSQKGDTGGITLHATNNGASASIKTTIKIEGAKTPLSVDTKSFADASKGRNPAYSFNGHDIALKDGKFEATIATTGTDATQEFSESFGDQGTTDIKLTEDHKIFLTKALAVTKIEKTFSALADLLVYVKATEKEVLVSTFENHQVAYIRAKNKVGFPVCDFVIPLAAASKIPVMPMAFRLRLSESLIDMSSKTARLQMPLSVETINAIPKDAVMELIRSTFKEQPVTTTIEKAQLLTFIENSRSVSVVGTEVTLSPAGKSGVQLVVKSPKGTVKEKFSGTCSGKISMDLRFLTTMLAKAGQNLEISNMGPFVLLKSDGVSYIAAYNASAEGGAEESV